MDSNADDGNFEVMEWRIINLGFWNKEIHGTAIEQYYSGLDLFPRGKEGNGERLILQVHDNVASSVDASFIGSDGSLLCERRLSDPKWIGGLEVLPPGPKFEKVVQARQRNPDRKDTLTIICRLKKLKGLLYRVETELVASDLCISVSNELLNYIPVGPPIALTHINYPKDEVNNNVDLLVSYVPDDTRFILSLNVCQAPQNDCPSSQNILIHTNLSLRDTDDYIVKYQENDHFFRGTEKWIFSDVFHKNEVVKNGYSLIISLKVITGLVELKKAYSISLEQCSKVVTPPSSENARKSKSLSALDSIDLLSKELMTLFQDKDHADFHFHCENVSFATHRGILSARSPVFKSMLSSGMKEAESGFMEITDLDANTLERFLAFLYSGVIEDLQWENVLKLYYSADKYQVPSLKNECRRVLISSISTSNVCRILSLAYNHEDDDLLSVAEEFLLENYKVLKSKEWDTLIQNEPYLTSKTLTRIVLGKSTQNGNFFEIYILKRPLPIRDGFFPSNLFTVIRPHRI